ncbi:MAG: outer membrane protein assembly factor BamB [Gammaproteobacteria bacterium]
MRGYLLLAVAALLISGCSNFGERLSERATDTGGWISEQLSGTGKAKDPAELVEFEPQFKAEKILSKSLSDGVGRGYPKPVPAYYGEQVYVVDDRLRGVTAWNYQNRDRLWSTEFEQKIAAGVSVDETRVLVVSDNAELLSLNRQNGELLWQSQLTSEVVTPPVSNGEVIVITTTDGKLLGLDANNGQQKWMIEHEVPALSLRGNSLPLIIGDMVVKGFADGRMTAVETNTGYEQWETPVGLARGRSELDRIIDADSNPVADGGVIFASAYQGRVVAIGQNSGEVLWSRTLSSYSDIALDLFNIYLSDDQDTVWALDRRTGATYWKQDALNARRITAPAVVGDYLVVADFEGYLHWMDRDDGSFVARSRPSKTMTSSPLRVIDDQLHLMTDEGELIILAPPGGAAE